VVYLYKAGRIELAKEPPAEESADNTDDDIANQP
jgi:hypothetical protein